jgi:hypothetical protein
LFYLVDTAVEFTIITVGNLPKMRIKDKDGKSLSYCVVGKKIRITQVNWTLTQVLLSALLLRTD